MSETLTIGLIAEGVTDYEILKSAIESMLDGQSFNLKLLQPEGSVAFTGGGDAGILGGGWKGVYRWCLQSALRGGGTLGGDPFFVNYDLLILHLDADVASKDPAHERYPVTELAGILPCESPCPPAHATTDALRAVMLSWIGEADLPPNTVFCTPSKSTESWEQSDYSERSSEFRRSWPRISETLSEATRFRDEFIAAVQNLSPQ